MIDNGLTRENPLSYSCAVFILVECSWKESQSIIGWEDAGWEDAGWEDAGWEDAG